MRKIWLCFLLISSLAVAQDKDSLDLSKYTLFENDSLITNLEEIQIMQRLQFKTYNDKRYYYWFRRKVLRAYPFAEITAKELSKLNNQLDSISSKRKRKRHIKEVQKFLEEEFEPQLKKLTRTEGRILIKLIHRQTGEVVYDLVKEYRSGWSAFWYNTTANFFKLSIKDEFNPAEEPEDYMIEDILQRAWRDNLIDLEKPKLDFDYFTLEKKWDLGLPEDLRKKEEKKRKKAEEKRNKGR